jgi:hypothetical protein
LLVRTGAGHSEAIGVEDRNNPVIGNTLAFDHLQDGLGLDERGEHVAQLAFPNNRRAHWKQEDALRILGKVAHSWGARADDPIEAAFFEDRRERGPIAKPAVEESFSGRIGEENRGPTRLRFEDAPCALLEC